MTQRSFHQATREERNSFVTRLRMLAALGHNTSALVTYLRTEFPQFTITFDVVRHHVRANGIVVSPLGANELTRVSASALVKRDRAIDLLRRQLAESRRLYQTAMRSSGLAQQIIRSVRGEITAMPSVSVAPPHLTRRLSHSPQDVVCLNSCLHFGEVVSEAETMGLGGYSPLLAAARWQYYVDSVLDLAVNHHGHENIRKLYVVNVGDNVSGNIHEELRETNALPLGAQIVRCAYLLAAGIRDLAASFEAVEFVGVVGNHGRFTVKPSFKDKTNNADWLVYQLVKALLRDQSNVTVTVPGAAWATMAINGHQFFFTHGDNIKSYFQFPWYDAKRFITEMGLLLTAGGQPHPRYWGFGQFHQLNIAQLSYGEWLFTGSFKGPDEYSIGKLRAGTPPTQLFFGVHERRGVSFRYPVVMDDASPEVQTRYLRFAEPAWGAEREDAAAQATT